MESDKKPICPRCKVELHKAGFGWSGKNRIQRYRCGKCGCVIQRKEVS